MRKEGIIIRYLKKRCDGGARYGVVANSVKLPAQPLKAHPGGDGLKNVAASSHSTKKGTRHGR